MGGLDWVWDKRKRQLLLEARLRQTDKVKKQKGPVQDVLLNLGLNIVPPMCPPALAKSRSDAASDTMVQAAVLGRGATM